VPSENPAQYRFTGGTGCTGNQPAGWLTPLLHFVTNGNKLHTAFSNVIEVNYPLNDYLRGR